AQKTAVRIGTLNMNGYGNLIQGHKENKWGKMYRTMQDQRIGILLLQETHLTESRRRDVQRIFARRIKVMHSEHPTAPTQREGVAIVINKRIVNAEGARVRVVVPGRALHLTMPWRGGEERRILCIYAPTSAGSEERRRFYEQVSQYYEDNRELGKPHLMAGDFNNVEDAIDRVPARMDESDRSVDALDELKRVLGLSMVDGWRKTHPGDRAFTFQRGSGEQLTMSRLDRIYIKNGEEKWAREWKIEPVGVRTDHSMATVLLTTPTAPEVGKGRPVFPLGLLKDKHLAKQMKARGKEAMDALEEVCKEGRSEERNAQTILHALKRDWLGMARKREQETVPKMLLEIKEAEERLKELAKLDDERTEVRDEQRKLTDQVRSMKEIRIKQRQARTKAKHRCDGELPTKYWTGIHRDPKPRELIPAFEKEGILTREGERVYETNPERMAEMARKHYDGIQEDGPEITRGEERENDIKDTLKHITERVTEEDAEEMAAEVSEEDVELALRTAKAGTAPGLDGIQYEVWKTMHERYKENERHPERAGNAVNVAKILTEALVDIQRHGVAKGTNFAEGWIAPIYKEKGELTKVVNYRPITLLNTDYKLLTKIMAVKL
ncbi:Endonuclease/exonuclease/phosphatase, partial [Lenzites betulinus]